MKKTIFLLTILLLTTATITLAQDDSDIKQWREQKRQKEAALQQAAEKSESAMALKAKVDEQKEGVILEAVKTGDRSLTPYLKQLASNETQRSNQNSYAFQAHAALAKLGDENALQEILDELKSDNLRVKGSAIAKLALVGSKTAYRKLFELLDDTLHRPTGVGDVYGSNSRVAMIYLGKTVENPPRLPNGNVERSIPAWKAWFAKNKHLIE